MSFVLFAFLLLFECIKPFGIGLFARTAPALAHLLVLLLLELQRLLRFGAMPTCAVCRPASRCARLGLRCAGFTAVSTAGLNGNR